MNKKENETIELLDVGKKWLKKSIKFLKMQVSGENISRTIMLSICGIIALIKFYEHEFLFVSWVLLSSIWVYKAFKFEKDAKKWERKYNILKYRGENHND